MTPLDRDESNGESRTYEALWLAFVVGLVAGFGCAGFMWMNFYIALSLALGGLMLFATIVTAMKERSR